jgi:hypothetical protein
MSVTQNITSDILTSEFIAPLFQSASLILALGLLGLIACHCSIAVYVAYSCAFQIPHLIPESREEEEEESDELCYACFETRPNTMLLSCGHQGLCTPCVKKLWDIDKRCPLCRAELKGVAFLD